VNADASLIFELGKKSMQVTNIYSRKYPVLLSEVGCLIDSLSSKNAPSNVAAHEV
jgi:hypothetical protein